MEREEITYPLGNSDFLRVLTNSFKEFIEKGTSRSTAKLKTVTRCNSTRFGRKVRPELYRFFAGVWNW